MTSSPLRKLSKVDVYVSVVLTSTIEETWQQARDFGHSTFWNYAGNEGEFHVKRLKGKASSEVGSGRMFKAGEGRLFEKLTALDDLKHNMRWMVISHPQTLSPFGQASFLNYSSRLRFRTVTNTNQTFGEWKGEFYTEPQYAEEMEVLLSSWYHAGFEGLETIRERLMQTVAAGQPGAQNVSGGSGTPVPPPPASMSTLPDLPDQFRSSQQKPPNPQFDMGVQMGNWVSRRFTYHDREQAGHPIGLAKKPRASGSAHPLPASSSRLSRQGSEARQLSDARLASSPSNGQPVFQMQGPPVNMSSNIHDSLPSRFNQSSSKTSSRPHRPSSTSVSAAPPIFPASGNERSSSFPQNTQVEYSSYMPNEEYMNQPYVDPRSTQQGSNSNPESWAPPTSHAQERGGGAAIGKSAHPDQTSYDASGIAALRPTPISPSPGEQHPAHLYRGPLTAEQRAMHTKPSLESVLTSGSQRSGYTYPRLSQYASQQSIDPSGYPDWSEGGAMYDSQYSQGLPSGPSPAHGPNQAQQLPQDHAMQEASAPYAHPTQAWNLSGARDRSSPELSTLAEERPSTNAQYSIRDDAQYSGPRASALEQERLQNEGMSNSGGSSSQARAALEQRQSSNPGIPNTKVQPSPFAQPASNGPKAS